MAAGNFQHLEGTNIRETKNTLGKASDKSKGEGEIHFGLCGFEKMKVMYTSDAQWDVQRWKAESPADPETGSGYQKHATNK